MPFVTCPACDHEHVVSRYLVGLNADCPKCEATFTVTVGSKPKVGRFVQSHRRQRSGLLLIIIISIVCLVFSLLAVYSIIYKSSKSNNSKAEIDKTKHRANKSIPVEMINDNKLYGMWSQFDQDARKKKQPDLTAGQNRIEFLADGTAIFTTVGITTIGKWSRIDTDRIQFDGELPPLFVFTHRVSRVTFHGQVLVLTAMNGTTSYFEPK